MAELRTAPKVRELCAADLGAVIAIDAAHTGERDEGAWQRVFASYVAGAAVRRIDQAFAIGVDVDGALAGYLFGEVRTVEFGSDPAGWVFSVGVATEWQRRGVARALVDEARRRFAALGVRHVRTMVRRNDVAILSFFRSAGFVGGPFVQLEIELGTDQENGS
ncbi:MAG: GNAT family N-acetyltransferase [Planctomycetes bacterium]|nr:GNAT family N-acetyltransferase [Planctomycetota bacterium]